MVQKPSRLKKQQQRQKVRDQEKSVKRHYASQKTETTGRKKSGRERIVWVVITVLAAFTFGVSFTMTSVIEYFSGRGQTICTIGGTSYSFGRLDQIKNLFDWLEGLSGRTSYRQLTLAGQYIMGENVPGIHRRMLIPLLAGVHEAELLGIEIPPRRIMEVARECYKTAATRKKVYKITEFMNAKEREEFDKAKRAEDIAESITWAHEDYLEWLTEKQYSARDFEEALEQLLRVEALREMFVSGEPVSRKDVYESFLKQDRKLKLALVELTADRFPAAEPKEYTEEELKRYYDEHSEDFQLPSRVRFSYLKFPLSHFRQTVSITEKQIQEYYDKNKAEKYLRNPSAPPPVLVYPLTPSELKQEEEFAKALYKPLEDVREDIERELREKNSYTDASTFAIELTKKLKAPAPLDADASHPGTPERLAAEYDFVEYGATSWFTQADAERKLGDVYDSRAVSRWFRNLEENNPLWQPTTHLSHKATGKPEDEQETTYFVVVDVEGSKEQTLVWEKQPDRCKEVAREKKNLAAALERAREKADELIVKIRADMKLEEVAAGYPIHVTDALEKKDYDKIVLTNGEKLPWRVQYGITDGVFNKVALNEKVLSDPVLDTENDRLFVCTIRDVLGQPDSSEFTEEKEQQLQNGLQQRTRSERLTSPTGWSLYLRRLVDKHVDWSARMSGQRSA